MSYILITDSTSDLGYEYMEKNNVPFLPLCYIVDDKEYLDDMGKTVNVHDFYENMRNQASLPVTAQINTEQYKEFFTPFLLEGKDIIYICFSSGLSGSYDNACFAREELLEQHPECKIEVIDSRAACMGEGLLVWDAVEHRDKGANFETLVERIRNRVPKTIHWFTVDDLNHLYRGGRVSKSAAFIGSVLNIKPVLHVDEAGHLIPVEKVRGRGKALKRLAEKVQENIVDSENQTILISHGDAYEDALVVQREVEKLVKVKGFYFSNIGPVIGAHSGPGTVAIFFFGNSKKI